MTLTTSALTYRGANRSPQPKELTTLKTDFTKMGEELTATSYILAAMLWAEEHGDDHPLVKTYVLASLAPLTLEDTESIRGAVRMLAREFVAELKERGSKTTSVRISASNPLQS